MRGFVECSDLAVLVTLSSILAVLSAGFKGS